MFEGVCITSDMPDQAAVGGGAGGGADAKAETAFYGGNRLIVAARHDDWLRIKKLCEELDTPQPQVIIEVLVADLTNDDTRNIASMLRNPLTVPLLGDVQFQSAQIPSTGGGAGIIVDNPNLNDGLSPATIGLDNVNHNNDADLLRDVYNGSVTPPTLLTPPVTPATTNESIASQATPGTMAVSLIDPCTKKVWSMLEIYNSLDYRKVLTNPHIVAVNNKQTKLVIGETRLVADAAVGNQGGNATVPRKPIKANLVLNIKPRICLSPDGDPANDTVQLGIVVHIEDFQTVAFTTPTPADPQGANTFTRDVTTSAHVRSRDVIPLGGLLRRDTSQTLSETPVLGKIPIIGYFFKNRGGTATDTNLTVFLCPTVVRPRLRRGGVDRYTRDYVKLTKKYAQEGLLFDTLKDPVTRWFFNTESDVIDTINDFLSEDEFKGGKEVRILTKRSEARAEARRIHTAQELEYQEMQAKDDELRAMTEPMTALGQGEKITLVPEQIKPAPLESKPMQEACNKIVEQEVLSHEANETMVLALQNDNLIDEHIEDKIQDKEARLKLLIQNEKNPLQQYLPA